MSCISVPNKRVLDVRAWQRETQLAGMHQTRTENFKHAIRESCTTCQKDVKTLTNKKGPQYGSKEDGVSSNTIPNEPGREIHDAGYEEADIGCKQVESQPKQVRAQGREEEEDICKSSVPT